MNTTSTNRRFRALTATAMLMFSMVTTSAFFGVLSHGISQGVTQRMATIVRFPFPHSAGGIVRAA